jgi:exosortase/archaeosortase family protein
MSQKTTIATTDAGRVHEPTLGERLGLSVAASASWRFVVVFGGTAAVLLAVYYFPYPAGSSMRKLLDAYLHAYAALAGAVLRPFEPSLVVVGQDIIGRYSMRIVKTCDGMDVNILFVSAIMAWPSALRPRLIAAALGLAILVATNTTRICTLYYVGVYAPASFEFVHIELWPAAILALAAALFLVFIAKTRSHASP